MVRGRKSVNNCAKVSSDECRKIIEKKAYKLWQNRGCPIGDDWSDWLGAEKIINNKR